MKRFALYGVDLTGPEQEIWRNVGFDLVSAGAVDVAWLGSVGSLERSLRLLDQLMIPKVFMLQTDKSGLFPECRQTIYSLKEYGESLNVWLLGTKLEAPLPDDMGALLAEKNTAALAEFFYYYLLRDVFRETADWCGHMSSVVGRM